MKIHHARRMVVFFYFSPFFWEKPRLRLCRTDDSWDLEVGAGPFTLSVGLESTY